MLPRWHLLLGAVFTGVIWVFARETQMWYLLLVFLSSVIFIDLDHYMDSVIKNKSLRMSTFNKYHDKLRKVEEEDIRKGIRRRGPFHIFHTIEFHVLIGLLGFIWIGFFYVFIGMVFHSLTDIFDMASKGRFHRREFFFFNWLRNKL
ncbi:hypothetical protein CMI47_15190 [Candidatus Pacearchaeota archaeon]|nr:hypothetical protein [Candidatus Pacearchaeota archaeon]|tara:strand:- start:1508 stop:1948 length:441 start_codon:yes stop_codon:yes gene_type:complete